MAEGQAAQHEKAWEDAREQLDFVLKHDMDRLLAFQSPPPVALLAVQAAVAVAGLLPGKPEELDWDQLKPLLSNPGDFLAQLAEFAAADREHVLATLKPMVARDDFRPACLLPVSPACAHLCRWCLTLFVRSGGFLPEPRHKSPPPPRPRRSNLPERMQIAAQRRVNNERQAVADSAALEAKAEEQAGGGLRVSALSGEVVAKLAGALAEWDRRDIAAKLKESWPAPAGHIYKLISGTTPMKGNMTLADLGLNPASPEGAEVTVVAMPIPEHAALVERAAQSLDCLNKADVRELKAFKRPPQMAQLACQAVYCALHPNSQAETVLWKDCQNMLGDRSLVRKLKEFDLEDDPARVEAVLKPFVDRDDFHVEYVLRVSSAAAGFCLWSRAIYDYSKALLWLTDLFSAS
mmetsp:Transcript_3032/g.9083  ORF Transcript_3032/g.9083 Transcript_3032/m.9083 type:complete len:406 (-) Transcript_3032:42-1259(-)